MRNKTTLIIMNVFFMLLFNTNNLRILADDDAYKNKTFINSNIYIDSIDSLYFQEMQIIDNKINGKIDSLLALEKTCTGESFLFWIMEIELISKQHYKIRFEQITGNAIYPETDAIVRKDSSKIVVRGIKPPEIVINLLDSVMVLDYHYKNIKEVNADSIFDPNYKVPVTFVDFITFDGAYWKFDYHDGVISIIDRNEFECK